MPTESIIQELKGLYRLMDSKGELLSRSQLEKCYNTFRMKFGPERLSGLDGEALLETIHNSSNKESLVYWLEFKDDDELPAVFGSIAGGSALKFGIYRRKETGAWMTGNPRDQKELSIEEAVGYARKHRDQLLKGINILKGFSENGTDKDYAELQIKLQQEAPDVQDTAWGHKYFSMFFPDILDQFHNRDYQRFHLIKLLEMPPEGEGRYIAAGRYITIAKKLEIPTTNLMAILIRRNGSPHQYWRIGTSNLGQSRNWWQPMRDGNFVAIGWAELGDLSGFRIDQASREAIKSMLKERCYQNNPQLAGRKGQEVFNFFWLHDGEMVLAADGSYILGIGRITGDYFYDPTSTFPHRHSVEWLNLEEWKLPETEGLQTTVAEIKQRINQIEVEKKLQNSNVTLTENKPTKAPIKIPEYTKRIQSILERKGQVILYGPPGTGKTYWAEKSARDLIALSSYSKFFEQLDSPEQLTITGDNKKGLVRICCFHPSYGYEDFIEGYRPQTNDGQIIFNLRNGIFKDICRDAQVDPGRKYYLIIDEINRGDIPRIFGELITLIEKDKRGKKIILPISNEVFQVPENVYIIGTMNTADRSIALLDTALRRRFGFIELMPETEILSGVVIEGIPLGPWLEALNQQICESIGRDARNLQIGHSYFLDEGRPIKDFSRFVKVIREDIIPLLEEYCYEDYTTLERILGKGLVDARRQMIQSKLFDPSMQGQLIQALLAPFPDLSSSLSAIVSVVEHNEIDPEETDHESGEVQ